MGFVNLHNFHNLCNPMTFMKFDQLHGFRESHTLHNLMGLIVLHGYDNCVKSTGCHELMEFIQFHKFDNCVIIIKCMQYHKSHAIMGLHRPIRSLESNAFSQSTRVTRLNRVMVNRVFGFSDYWYPITRITRFNRVIVIRVVRVFGLLVSDIPNNPIQSGYGQSGFRVFGIFVLAISNNPNNPIQSGYGQSGFRSFRVIGIR